MSHNNHCEGESCSTEHQSKGSCHSGECAKGCGSGCGCGCCQKQEQHFSDKLLCMADEAWREVLKDKIKQKIQESTGQHLDQLATLVAAANHERWNEKMAGCKAKETFKDKIAAFFNR